MSAASSAEPGGAAAAAAAAAGAEPKSSRLADEGDMFFSVKKWDCVVSWMFGREGDQNLQDCAICKNALTEPSVTYETDPCETYADGKVVATGTCNHRYHLDCIKQWCRKGQNLCPICGSPWSVVKEHEVVT